MSRTPEALGDEILIADGGWSSALQEAGYPLGLASERAVLQRRDLIETIARAYLEAGAQFLSTHTFAANALAAETRGIEEDLAELNQEAARVIRAIAEPGGATTVGVLGPSGKIVSVGEVSEEQLFDVYSNQAQALRDGGAEWLRLETFSELREITVAIQACRQASGLPVIACLSFDSGPQRTQTIMGLAADTVAEPLEEAGADVIGLNCGAGWQHVLPATVALRSHTQRPLWVSASAGVPDLVEGQPRYQTKPEDFDEVFQQVLAVGPQVVGGCCGVHAAHIRRFAHQVRAHQRRG